MHVIFPRDFADNEFSLPQKPNALAEISVAGRRRMAAATKKRWAEFHRKQAAATQKAKQPAAATKSETIVVTILDSIVRSLRSGDRVEIRWFGSFGTAL
jgi:hypothetical protein